MNIEDILASLHEELALLDAVISLIEKRDMRVMHKFEINEHYSIHSAFQDLRIRVKNQIKSIDDEFEHNRRIMED